MTFIKHKLPRQATILACPGTVNAMFLSDAIEGLRRDAPWHVPLFQAVLANEIALIIPLPTQILPMAWLKTISKPVIVLVCDDGPVSDGPGAWACATRAFHWAAASIINGTGGDRKIYTSAVMAVRETQRVTICDTSSAHFEAWRACASAAGDKPVLGFRPPPGHQHPRMQ